MGRDIDPVAEPRLAREFMATPLGVRSPDLMRLLRAMRGGPVRGKYALLATVPGRRWTPMQLSGRRDGAAWCRPMPISAATWMSGT